MMILRRLCFAILFCFPQSHGWSQGFSANRVSIEHTLTGFYRVSIQYTHIKLGEYRVAVIDFKDKQEAIDIYQKLVSGASFYLGNAKKNVVFEEDVQLKPF